MIALCGIFVYSYTSRLHEKTEIEARIVAKQAQIDAARHRQFQLLEQLKAVHQPDFLDQVAREEFGLSRAGETVITVIKPPTEAATPFQTEVEVVAAAAENQVMPVWQQWMTLFSTGALRVD